MSCAVNFRDAQQRPSALHVPLASVEGAMNRKPVELGLVLGWLLWALVLPGCGRAGVLARAGSSETG
jgi:hypothetical protein